MEEISIATKVCESRLLNAIRHAILSWALGAWRTICACPVAQLVQAYKQLRCKAIPFLQVFISKQMADIYENPRSDEAGRGCERWTGGGNLEFFQG